MALGNCEECGKLVSTKASACPHCGVPQKKSLSEKVKRKGWVWGCIVAVLAVLITIVAPKARPVLEDLQQQYRMKKAVAAREKILERKFLEQREGLYSKLAAYVRSDQFGKARNILALFRQNNQMDYEDVREIGRNIRIHDLQEEVSKVPAAETQKNIDFYSELLALDPENRRYKKKVAYYKAQQQKEQKEGKRRIAKFGKQPEKSETDGSIECVKEYLQSVAYDSASLKYDQWSDVYYREDDGWLVRCEFRGKNPFGVYVNHVKWFVIQHGRVVDVREHNAEQRG